MAEVITNTTTAVIQKQTTSRLQPNHTGRNHLPEELRRETQIINPDGMVLFDYQTGRGREGQKAY